MRSLIETLCSDNCAGRAPGAVGGRAARTSIVAALREAGLDPHEQPIAGIPGGANVLATLRGDIDRYVLVSAHYDHLGSYGSRIYRGADDNAAAIAVLVEVARALAKIKPAGRGVIIAAFDSEEPPHFLTPTMGSEFFATHPSVPLHKIDMMIGMDLIGHRIGSAMQLPAAITESLFVLGAERSVGTTADLAPLMDAEVGVRIRPIDAEMIPPMSDYHAFWKREVPFLFLTAGRSRYYHTTDDTPETLDFKKMAATARWLTRYVRQCCARPEARIVFREDRDLRSTLRTLVEVTAPLRTVSVEASTHHNTAERLLAQCDRNGNLPSGLQLLAMMTLGALEKLIE